MHVFLILYTLPTCWPVAGFHPPGDQFAILCFKGLLRPSYRLKPHLHQKGFTGTGIYYIGKALLSRIPLKQHNHSSPGLLTPPHHAPRQTLGAHVLFPCKATHRFLLETSKPAPPRTYKTAPAPARGQTGLKFNP